MNRLAILAIPLVLSGCGIPPAVTIASYAVDGAIWAASGKTVRDHALSTVVEQDCSMFRVVTGRPICVDYEPSAAAAAALEEMPASEEMLATTSDGRVIRVAAAPVNATDMPAIAAEPASRASERALLTTDDGRVIRVAGTAPDDAGDTAVPSVRLSWVPPGEIVEATR